MKKSVVSGLMAAAGLAASFSTAQAQAPSTSQYWEVRFIVDGHIYPETVRLGGVDTPVNRELTPASILNTANYFPEGPNATEVGITLQARVAIGPTTATASTANFGVNKIGGVATASSTQSDFHMFFQDPAGNVGGNQGSLSMGATGQAGTDVFGQPIAGLFSAFRTGLTAANGNTDTPNGIYATDGVGRANVTNIVGSRSTNYSTSEPGSSTDPNHKGALGWGDPVLTAGVPTGFVNASGEPDDDRANGASQNGVWANVYRWVFKPNFNLANPAQTPTRNITVLFSTTTGDGPIGGRYIFGTSNPPFASASTRDDFLTAHTFTFLVPSPGGALLAGLAGLVAVRRRRR